MSTSAYSFLTHKASITTAADKIFILFIYFFFIFKELLLVRVQMCQTAADEILIFYSFQRK